MAEYPQIETDPIAENDVRFSVVGVHRFRAGRWYTNGIDTGGGVANGNGFPVYSPFVFGRSARFDRIGLEVTSAVAGSVVRMGAHFDDGTGMPGALIQDFGTLDSSSLGQKSIVIDWQPLAGAYQLVTVNQGVGTPSVRANQRSWWPIGAFAAANVTAQAQYPSGGGVPGALPSVAAVPNVGIQFSPTIWLRAA